MMERQAHRGRAPVRLALRGMALVLAVGGCTVPRAGGFAELQSLIGERTGRDVRWIQDQPQDEEVRAAIERLLDGTLDVDTAVQIALLNNPAVQATYGDLGIAQADVVQAGLLKNPVFSGSARFPIGGGVTNLAGGVVEDFLSVVLLPARKRIAAAQFEETKFRVASAVLDLAREVRDTFYGLEAARNVAAVVRTSADVAKASAEYAARLRKAGNLSELDATREQALAADLEVQLARAEGEVVLARQALARRLGPSSDARKWTVPNELPPIPKQEADLQDLERTALRQRLELAAARSQVDALREALGLARLSTWFPFVNVGVDAERDVGRSIVIGPTLSLELPIFDQGQAKRARLEAALQQGEKRLEALAVDVASELRSARAKLLLARQLVDLYRSVLLPLRERLVSLSLEQYNYMVLNGGAFTVLADKREQVGAYRDYVSTVRDYWIARSAIERAIAGRLPEAAAIEAVPPMDHEYHHGGH